jgi:CheY-like chemotaxis protein
MTTTKDNLTVLLVDDEPDITTIFTLGLEDNGFKVDTFNNPLEALSSFKPGAYDLALIDYKMADMNGFELHAELRKLDTPLKVCFITAYEIYLENAGGQHQRTTSRQHNIAEVDVKCFIQKPIAVAELVKRVKEELHS